MAILISMTTTPDRPLALALATVGIRSLLHPKMRNANALNGLDSAYRRDPMPRFLRLRHSS